MFPAQPHERGSLPTSVDCIGISGLLFSVWARRRQANPVTGQLAKTVLLPALGWFEG